MSNENAEVLNDGAAPESFRSTIEKLLDDIHDRVCRMEAGGGGETGDSAAGLLRTFGERIQQMETVAAENASANLRLADMVQSQLAGVASRVAALESQVKALTPAQ